MPASEPTPQAGTTVSPKVTWAAMAGLGVTVLVAVLTAIGDTLTEESLSPLGVWAAPTAVLASTIIATIVGYYKADRLRDQTPVIKPVTVVQAGGETATGYAGGDVKLPPATTDYPDVIPAGDGEHRAG